MKINVVASTCVYLFLSLFIDSYSYAHSNILEFKNLGSTKSSNIINIPKNNDFTDKPNNKFLNDTNTNTLDIKDSNIKFECNNSNIEICKKIFQSNNDDSWSNRDLLLIFGLLVSVGFNIYNIFKDKKIRIRSVNDDFWIRKILSPITIEPLIKETLEIVENLPNDCSDKSISTDRYEEYVKKYQPIVIQLSSNMRVLKLLGDDVYNGFDSHLKKIEDIILDYCGDNTNKINAKISIPTFSKNDTREEIIESMNKMLSILKSYQTTNI